MSKKLTATGCIALFSLCAMLFASTTWAQASNKSSQNIDANRFHRIISFVADGDMLAGGLFGLKRWNIGQDN